MKSHSTTTGTTSCRIQILSGRLLILLRGTRPQSGTAYGRNCQRAFCDQRRRFARALARQLFRKYSDRWASSPQPLMCMKRLIRRSPLRSPSYPRELNYPQDKDCGVSRRAAAEQLPDAVASRDRFCDTAGHLRKCRAYSRMVAISGRHANGPKRNQVMRLHHKFCVAPMMDWTDRHCRFFHRLLTRAGAALHGDGDGGGGPARRPRAAARLHRRRSIRWRCSSAAPIPAKLAEAAAIGEDFGYDEINLNVGCPSDRVQEGRFGACLMAEPELVADCVAAMRGARGGAGHGQVPHRHRRPGQRGGPGAVRRRGGGRRLPDVHRARAQGLAEGLSPKENREVPPLDYDRVYRLKAAHPELEIVHQRRHRRRSRRPRRIWARSTASCWAAPPIRTPICWPRSIGALFGGGDAVPLAAAGHRGSSSPTPSGTCAPAAGSTISPGTSSASTTAGRARAPSAATLSEQAPREGAGIGVLLEAMRIAEGEQRGAGWPQNSSLNARLPCAGRAHRASSGGVARHS